MRDLSYITEKFYSSEEERLRKMFAKKQVIQEVGTALKETILKLYTWKIRFIIFETIEDASLSVMYAGLIYCCGEREYESVNINIRMELEEEIKGKTRYKKIIWEI